MPVRFLPIVALAPLVLPLLDRSSAAAPAATDPCPRLTHGTGEDPDAAATCGKCHVDFYDEWKQDVHSHAWTNPVYQAAVKEKTRPEVCYPCHIPEAVLDRIGRKPKTRDHHQDEGVTCVSCHRQGEVIHGPFGAATDAHPSAKDPGFSEQGSVHLCSSCHATKIGPVLPVAKDFEEAGMAEHGKSCVGCHMPEVERHLAISIATGKPTGEVRPARRHHMLGPNDPEFCAKAFRVSGEVTGDELLLAIENMAGHRVPGLTLRKFPVVVRSLDGDGKVLGEDRFEISSDNVLMAAEKREFRFAARKGTELLQVEVQHVFNDGEPTTVKVWEVEP